MAETVKFDPGIGEFVIDFTDYIDRLYTKMSSLVSSNQKKIQFKLAVDKIQNIMKNNIAFYCGCLMWAYYIKNMQETKDITGNTFLNMPENLRKEYDYSSQVNFLFAYFEVFERDTKYYLNKKIAIPEKWKNILNVYNEFLKLNNGFFDTKTNKDIILPEAINNYNFGINIEDVINNSIKNKNIEILLEYINL
ncbi:hypothetical protein II906_09095 [bacterium]|nr:hypothetical protein [bacterium]